MTRIRKGNIVFTHDTNSYVNLYNKLSNNRGSYSNTGEAYKDDFKNGRELYYI